MRLPISFPSPSFRVESEVPLFVRVRIAAIVAPCASEKHGLILQGTDAQRARRKDARRDTTTLRSFDLNVCAEPHFIVTAIGQTYGQHRRTLSTGLQQNR